MERIEIGQRIAGRKHKEIFEQILKIGTVSKLDLLDQSGLTGSTLTRTLEELTAQGLIVEAGFGESTGGRRPILYETNPDYGYIFGLEISRMHSKLVLFDMHMNKLESTNWAMTEQVTPSVLLNSIILSVNQMLSKRSIPHQAVIGMGIGAVGPIDHSSGTILEPLYFSAAGWHNVPIVGLLEGQLHFPVLLDNGTNTALIGESWSDRDRDYRHLLYIHAAVGLRSAMMTGGKIVYGAVDMEGAIGQMIIQTDGTRLQGHGNYGALESYASIHAIEQQVRSRLKQGRSSVMLQMEKEPENIHFAHLLRAVQENDPLAVELFVQAATYFGIGLSNLLNILHPEKVILGGALISSHPDFFHIATRVAIERAYYYPKYQVVFSLGSLGEEAVVTGATIMVLNKMTES